MPVKGCGLQSAVFSFSVPQFVLRQVDSQAKQATIECRWEGVENARYEWLEEGRGKIGDEPTQEVQLSGLIARVQGEDPLGTDGARYACIVFDADSGEKLGQSGFGGLTKFKQANLNACKFTWQAQALRDASRH